MNSIKKFFLAVILFSSPSIAFASGFFGGVTASGDQTETGRWTFQSSVTFNAAMGVNGSTITIPTAGTVMIATGTSGSGMLSFDPANNKINVPSTFSVSGLLAVSTSVATGQVLPSDTVTTNLLPKVIAVVTVSAGSPSLTYAVNVTSPTDVQAGEVRLNFGPDFSDANYACAVLPASGHVNYSDQIAASIDIETRETALGNLTDNVSFTVVCFGNN